MFVEIIRRRYIVFIGITSSNAYPIGKGQSSDADCSSNSVIKVYIFRTPKSSGDILNKMNNL